MFKIRFFSVFVIVLFSVFSLSCNNASLPSNPQLVDPVEINKWDYEDLTVQGWSVFTEGMQAFSDAANTADFHQGDTGARALKLNAVFADGGSGLGVGGITYTFVEARDLSNAILRSYILIPDGFPVGTGYQIQIILIDDTQNTAIDYAVKSLKTTGWIQTDTIISAATDGAPGSVCDKTKIKQVIISLVKDMSGTPWAGNIYFDNLEMHEQVSNTTDIWGFESGWSDSWKIFSNQMFAFSNLRVNGELYQGSGSVKSLMVSADIKTSGGGTGTGGISTEFAGGKDISASSMSAFIHLPDGFPAGTGYQIQVMTFDSDNNGAYLSAMNVTASGWLQINAIFSSFINFDAGNPCDMTSVREIVISVVRDNTGTAWSGDINFDNIQIYQP